MIMILHRSLSTLDLQHFDQHYFTGVLVVPLTALSRVVTTRNGNKFFFLSITKYFFEKKLLVSLLNQKSSETF